MGRQRTPFSWAEFMAEEPVKPKTRSRVPVRVGVHLGAGSGDGYGRRGALGRSEKRGPSLRVVATASCTSMCAARFFLPIFRWGIDSSSSFALSIWEGDRHGSQEEETHPAPLSTSAEGLAVKDVIMPRSGQTAVDREADEGRS